MSPSKREREQARRRYRKRLARAERARRAARRRQLLALGVVAAMVLTGVVALVLGGQNTASSQVGDGQPTRSQTPDPAASTDPAPLPTTDPRTYGAPPPPTDALAKDWQAVLHTNRGDIAATLNGADAPQAVASFLRLAGDGFFEATACHRLLPDSLLQCGDPTATGTGGPGYAFGPIENAPADDRYDAGTLAMARKADDGDSMGSQFFLVFSDTTLPSDSAGGYTVFGHITSGLDVLKQIGQAGTAEGSNDGRPAENVIIESVDIK